MKSFLANEIHLVYSNQDFLAIRLDIYFIIRKIQKKEGQEQFCLLIEWWSTEIVSFSITKCYDHSFIQAEQTRGQHLFLLNGAVLFHEFFSSVPSYSTGF